MLNQTIEENFNQSLGGVAADISRLSDRSFVDLAQLKSSWIKHFLMHLPLISKKWVVSKALFMLLCPH